MHDIPVHGIHASGRAIEDSNQQELRVSNHEVIAAGVTYQDPVID